MVRRSETAWADSVFLPKPAGERLARLPLRIVLIMKFRCPHCQKLLETDEVGKFLCPICKKWSRVPVPKKTVAAEEEEILDVLAVPQESRGSRREAITDREPDRRPRRRDEEEVEDVDLEVVDEGDEGRPRRRKRPRRRRRSSGGDSILDSINLTLVLLVLLAPMGLGMVALLFFFVNPLVGLAGLLMVGGWIWFILIASEDGLLTVVLVMFVPFYSLYYASQNWDRVAIPFLMMVVGHLAVMLGGAIVGKKASGRRMEGPAPIVRMMACAVPISSNDAASR